MTVCLVIPAYEPSSRLAELISDLVNQSKARIVVVDDGSKDKSAFKDPVFNHKNVTLLEHVENLGKGAALKTAFAYIMLNFPEVKACVTLDADGQHTPEDVVKVASQIGENDSLILGVRNFTATNKQVPLKSRLGNLLTRKIWQLATGINVRDTQTGLRGIPLQLMKECLHIKENRYEFEMEMLFRAQKLNMSIVEIPISMIYIDDNKGSHFDPIRDSLKIYYVLVRFCLSSFFSLLVDYVIFSMLVFVFSTAISIAFVVARIISGIINYTLNKKVVFNFENKNKIAVLKYTFLLIVNMYVGFALIDYIDKYSSNPLFSKIFIEGILFFFNFYVQKDWVFRREEE